MLAPRTGAILKHIVGKYIERAVPVASQSIADSHELNISPATVRNEMAYLEQEGYIIRPHTSSGSVPTDKGYRYYVELLGNVKLPEAQQFMINHLFHQVEEEIERWLSLTATLLSRLVQNMAIVTLPKPAVGCKFKHVELVALQDSLALAVLVLYGAKVTQKLVTFDQVVLQIRLTDISNKLNSAYSGLTRQEISVSDMALSPIEKQIADHLVEMMQAEDEQEYEEPHLDGLHFVLSQPEFAHSQQMQALVDLVESRNLLKAIAPPGLNQRVVHVVIGKENKTEAIQNYSVVISKYGLPDEATGTIGVIGPTRMPYSNTIPSVDYLSSVLSEMVAGLYGK